MNFKTIMIVVLLSSLCLYTVSARYYNPATGRFITADTVTPGGGADLQGLNRYSYCINNPIKYIDPAGHEPFEQDHTAVSVTLNNNNYKPREFHLQSAPLPSLSPVINKIREQHEHYIDSLANNVAIMMEARDNTHYYPYIGYLAQLAVVGEKQTFEQAAHVKYDNVSSSQELLKLGVNLALDAVFSYGLNYPLMNYSKSSSFTGVSGKKVSPYIDNLFNPYNYDGNSYELFEKKVIGGINIGGNITYRGDTKCFSLSTSCIGTSDNNKRFFKNFLGQLVSVKLTTPPTKNGQVFPV